MHPILKCGAVVALGLASPAFAQSVDGILSPGEYTGSTTAVIATDSDAPVGNFLAPTNVATAGYTIYLTDTSGSLFGLISQTGGSAVGPFANLYFDLNPTVGDGSDLGFEMGLNGVTAFIPGLNGQPGFSTLVNPSLFNTASVTVNGLTTFEFRLSNSLFTSAIQGLNYYSGQTFEPLVTLRLSQSLSYSVAGGPTYREDRLGTVAVSARTGAVPEPASWAMMLIGFGGIGIALRRRRQIARTAADRAAASA